MLSDPLARPLHVAKHLCSFLYSGTCVSHLHRQPWQPNSAVSACLSTNPHCTACLLHHCRRLLLPKLRYPSATLVMQRCATLRTTRTSHQKRTQAKKHTACTHTSRRNRRCHRKLGRHKVRRPAPAPLRLRTGDTATANNPLLSEAHICRGAPRPCRGDVIATPTHTIRAMAKTRSAGGAPVGTVVPATATPSLRRPQNSPPWRPHSCPCSAGELPSLRRPSAHCQGENHRGRRSSV